MQYKVEFYARELFMIKRFAKEFSIHYDVRQSRDRYVGLISGTDSNVFRFIYSCGSYGVYLMPVI